MNRSLRLLSAPLLLAALLQEPTTLSAQTTLATGDLLFTSFNSNPSSAVGDTFSIVLLADIEANTEISFTDRGYLGGTLSTTGGTESSITWTVGDALAAGSEVLIYGLTAQQYDQASSTFTVNGSVERTEGTSANGLSLANTGDQIIAFQGGSGSVSASGGTLIAGIHYPWCNVNTTFNNWDAAPSTLGPNSSSMPPGLLSDVSAFYTGRVSPVADPFWGYFSCPATMPTSIEE